MKAVVSFFSCFFPSPIPQAALCLSLLESLRAARTNQPEITLFRWWTEKHLTEEATCEGVAGSGACAAWVGARLRVAAADNCQKRPQKERASLYIL